MSDVLAFLLTLLMTGGAQCGSPGLHGKGTPRHLNTLLACDASTSCDAQWIADDWPGSGAWISRDSNHWNASITGTLARTASLVFPGRNEVTGWSSSNFFTLPSNGAFTVNPSEKHTWEFVIRANQHATQQYFFGWYPGAGMVYVRYSDVGYECAVVNDASGQYIFASSAPTVVDGRNYILSCVIDLTAPSVTIYINGTQSAQSTATSGAMTSANHAFAMGYLPGTGAWPFQGGFLEILHHSSAISSGAMTARYALFNATKGY